MIEFYEERFKQDSDTVKIDDIMTEEEQERVSYYVKNYERLKEAMSERMTGDSGWESIEKLYKGKRVDSPIYSDNNREINVMLPNIEGQIASMTNQNISGSYKGVGYSDQLFAATAGRVCDFILDRNPIRNITKNLGRRYVKFGTCVLTVSWDKDAYGKMGLPRFEAPKISKVFVDDKVNDVVLDLESADYIIHEVGRKSLAWARDEYGDDIANAIALGNDSDDFGEDSKNEESFTYLRVWTRNNEKRRLQLLEISMNGILLSESEASSSYYKNVFDRYPFFFAGMYKDEADSYYFGDGYVLLPFQEYINKLLDVILRAVMFSSQGRTFADVNSGLNPDDFSKNDPAIPIMVRNINGIRVERGSGVNEVVFNLLSIMFTKIQEATRFSALMTGNSTGETLTATQAGIQTQQGMSGIEDKKKDISRILGEALSYSLGLCMQFWDSAKAFRIADNGDNFEWIDVREFKNIPEMIPTSAEYRQNYMKSNPDADVPDFMQLTNTKEEESFDEEGNSLGMESKEEGVTKQLELDINVNVGEGLPTNKASLFNLIMSLSQIALPDKGGNVRPLIEYEQFGKMVEDYFGITIDSLHQEEASNSQLVEQKNQLEQEVNAMGEELNGKPSPINNHPNIPGANANGNMNGMGAMF